jgi:hypothetical protein
MDWAKRGGLKTPPRVSVTSVDGIQGMRPEGTRLLEHNLAEEACVLPSASRDLLRPSLRD